MNDYRHVVRCCLCTISAGLLTFSVLFAIANVLRIFMPLLQAIYPVINILWWGGKPIAGFLDSLFHMGEDDMGVSILIIDPIAGIFALAVKLLLLHLIVEGISGSSTPYRKREQQQE